MLGHKNVATGSARGFRAFVAPLSMAALMVGAGVGCGGDEEGGPGAQTNGGWGGGAGGPGGGGRPGGGAPVPVAVERVERGDASSYYVATATLEASNRAEIMARTSGVVEQLLVEEGDRVKAGAGLLRLEDDEARWRLKQAEANLAAAQADYERGKAMLEGELLSAEEYEVMENTLRVREAETELARLEFSYTRVAAPFGGQVVRRLVDRGANVSSGTALYELMDVDPLLARVHIPAGRMGSVKIGQEMEILVASVDAELIGVVSLISPIVDPTTGTVKVTAEVKDPPAEIRAGDFAEVRIVTERHEDTNLVASRALFEDAGVQVLYVVEDGQAVRRTVETGFVEGDITEITSGVEPGDLIVTKGQRQLREGGAVEILEGPEDVMAAVAAAAEEVAEEEPAGDAAAARAEGRRPGGGKGKGKKGSS